MDETVMLCTLMVVVVVVTDLVVAGPSMMFGTKFWI